MASIDTNPLKVNFVLDVGHENEGGDDTLALRRGKLGADLAVPDVVCRGEQSADGALSHGEQRRGLSAAGVLVEGRHALGLPVDLGGIAEVLVDGLDIIQRVHLVFGRLAGGAGDARVE